MQTAVGVKPVLNITLSKHSGGEVILFCESTLQQHLEASEPKAHRSFPRVFRHANAFGYLPDWQRIGASRS